MGAAIIVDAGTALDPGSSGASCTAGQGSSFTVRGVDASSTTQLVGLTRGGATAGLVQIKSPYLQGPADGIRYSVDAADLNDLIADAPFQDLTPQDALSVSVTGGSSESDGALLTSYYQNLPGSNMVLKSPGDISGAAEWTTTWEVDGTASGTIGNWADTALTHLYDDSLGNRWYAVLGYVVATAILGVSIWGPDTSNFRIGGPGIVDPFKTKNYFQRLSQKLGVPAIPCFSSTNKAGTMLSRVDIAASTSSLVTLVVAIMPPTWTP